ncbi:ABC transporter permease [Marinobacter xestospongiae]|uniref:ABC transporter permease n=1 Tax=Marinobacter xestospongiae TaxID=994319 RepID=UPI002003E52E|nr:ABC transporter permease [Marinobacter xestospongiae]MCK7569031.1 ABC transporter permease [Marinobacter xestospongiae]
MTTLLSVVRDEMDKVVTNRRIFAIFFVAIAVLGLYYPQPYSAEVLREVAVAVVDRDDTTSSRQLTRDVDVSQNAHVVMKLPDVASAERAVFERRISGYLFIPQHFEREMLSGRQAEVAFYGDASYFLIFSKLRSAVGAAIQRLGTNVVVGRLIAGGMNPDEALAVASPMRINMIPLFNPEGGYASYVVPAVFLLIVQQLLLMGVGLLNTLPSERPRVDAPPIVATAGKLIAYMIPGVFLYLVATIIIPYAYNVPRIGDVWSSLAIAIPFSLAASALGLLFAAILRDALVVQLVCSLLGLPLFFMAGIAWPSEAMPELLQWARHLIPSTSGIDAAVRINQMGADLSDVAGPVRVLWILAAGYASLAALAMRLSAGRAAKHIDGIPHPTSKGDLP